MSDATISITCPQCHAKMRAPGKMAGKKSKCPKCKTELTIDAPLLHVPAEAQTTPAETDPAAEIDQLVDETLRRHAEAERLRERDDREAMEEVLRLAIRQAHGLTVAYPSRAAGWLAMGLSLALNGDFPAAAHSLAQAARQDAAGVGAPGLKRLVDATASFYAAFTFMPFEQLGSPAPAGAKELVVALQKVLILADREVPLPGTRATELLAQAKTLAAAPAPASSPPVVQCPACREDLKGHVARCPHCTSVLNWMNCPACRTVVATRVTQKFVGVARGGHQPVYHCIQCGKKLAGPDCFIATAAYGSTHEPHVELLRAFRDRVLNRTMLGRATVAAYYAVSPGLAARIRESPRRRRVVRVLLFPVVRLLRPLIRTTESRA